MNTEAIETQGLRLFDGSLQIGVVEQRQDGRFEAFAGSMPIGLYNRQQSAIEAVWEMYERKAVGIAT